MVGLSLSFTPRRNAQEVDTISRKNAQVKMHRTLHCILVLGAIFYFVSN